MPAKDITGLRSGRLVALSIAAKHDGKGAYWQCKCDCGNTAIVRGYSLRQEHTKSCGCLLLEHVKKMGANTFIDLTGKRYGTLVVVKRAYRQGSHIKWECQCDACGSRVIVFASNLRQRPTNRCSKCYTGKDLTGQQFGKLTVLHLAKEDRYNKHRQVRWKCKCDCGNIIMVITPRLATGHTRSCGCLQDAARFTRHTPIDPMDVPFGVTNVMKARRELKRAIRQAS